MQRREFLTTVPLVLGGVGGGFLSGCGGASGLDMATNYILAYTNNGLEAISLNGTSRKVVIQDAKMRFLHPSPDGRTLVVSYWVSPREYYIGFIPIDPRRTANASHMKRVSSSFIAKSDYNPSGFAWSHDSTYLAFIREGLLSILYTSDVYKLDRSEVYLSDKKELRTGYRAELFGVFKDSTKIFLSKNTYYDVESKNTATLNGPYIDFLPGKDYSVLLQGQHPNVQIIVKENATGAITAYTEPRIFMLLEGTYPGYSWDPTYQYIRLNVGFSSADGGGAYSIVYLTIKPTKDSYGDAQVIVKEGQKPVWSPDGQQMAYLVPPSTIRGSVEYSLIIADAYNNNPKKLESAHSLEGWA
jgi:hypothetical protein